jgi:hypothetical protein
MPIDSVGSSTKLSAQSRTRCGNREINKKTGTFSLGAVLVGVKPHTLIIYLPSIHSFTSSYLIRSHPYYLLIIYSIIRLLVYTVSKSGDSPRYTSQTRRTMYRQLSTFLAASTLLVGIASAQQAATLPSCTFPFRTCVMRRRHVSPMTGS